MNWNDFNNRYVTIEYLNMAKLNKLRAFARKMDCRIEVSRYARDAYEGKVIVPLTKSRDLQQVIVEEIANYIGNLR